MSQYLHSQSAAALGARRSIQWRSLFANVAGTMWMWVRRRQQRQELLDFMTIDHRAASDIGMTSNDARDWAQRPYWRA